MSYVKKPERYEKLKQDFLQKAAPFLEDYELLGGYINKDTKTLFRHKVCGNEFMMTPHNFKAGHGCPKCANVQRAKSIKKTRGNRFLSFLEGQTEYSLLSEHVNNTVRVRLRHNVCGAEFDYPPGRYNGQIRRGKTCLCPKCNLEAVKKKFSYSLSKANEKLEQFNSEYRFLSYSGSHCQAEILHKECGHKFLGTAYYFLNGKGHCPKCTTNISRQEKEIYAWLCSLGAVPEQSVRDIPNVSEVDLLVRDKNVGIEFNGHYWHSAQKLVAVDPRTGKPRMSYAEAKKYHYLKSFWCEKAGVRLIHIWDYEWADPRKQKVLKNIILGALGMLPERYYARQTICKHYEQGCARWQELSNFFAENNIQGNRGGSHVFALEDKDGRILMAYKFGRPSGGKAKKLYEYEMVRGASAPGVQVVGGASKLWKHFVDTLHPNSVVYYTDYNYFNGKSVEQLGGRFVISQPGVKNYWVKTEKVKNREPARHKEVKKAIERGECLELWNAGTKTYVFNFLV